ncbi:MAG: hypothetical protein OXI55_06070 [Gammaproteobacteria bacterium]|nr:hypothetical protein [Gammaproteobacteria bacterium]
MFNNPFGSFHDMVAEAKEEREQLDRLLTVSSPRDSVAVLGVALAALVLGMWLFLGSVSRSLTLDGVVLGAGEVSPNGTRSVQALVSVARDAAAEVEAGASVAVHVQTVASPATLPGTVTSLEVANPADGLAEFAARVPVGLYRMELEFASATVDFASLAGEPCKIVVELPGTAPAALVWKRTASL